jgi:hypothetical protein
MRERVEALASQVRRGELSFHEWQQHMAAFRSDDARATR